MNVETTVVNSVTVSHVIQTDLELSVLLILMVPTPKCWYDI